MAFYVVRFEHPDADGWQRELGAHLAGCARASPMERCARRVRYPAPPTGRRYW